MGLILLIFLCVNNAFRAKIRGLQPLPWVLYTVLAMAVGMFISMFVVVLTWVNKFGSSPEQVEEMQAMVKNGELTLNEWNMWFLLVCTFGGYLFIRYRIDKHPKLNADNNNSQ